MFILVLFNTIYYCWSYFFRLIQANKKKIILPQAYLSKVNYIGMDMAGIWNGKIIIMIIFINLEKQLEWGIRLYVYKIVSKGHSRRSSSLNLTHLWAPLRSTFAVRETASLGIMEGPRVPPLNPSETIVLPEHYSLWGVKGGHPRCPIMPRDVSLSDSKCWTQRWA